MIHHKQQKGKKITKIQTEDREYFKNVCCATTLGTAIKENKELKEKLSIAEADEEEEANLSCNLLEENKKLKEDVIYKDNIIHDYKREADTEHQRYLEAIENGSNNLWEISNVLDIEHHGGNKDIIKAIEELKDKSVPLERLEEEEEITNRMFSGTQLDRARPTNPVGLTP